MLLSSVPALRSISKFGTFETPASATAVFVAALALAAASTFSGTLLFVAGLPLVVAACAVATAAVWLPDGTTARSEPVIWSGLSMLATLGLIGPSGHGPLLYEGLRRTYFGAGLFVIAAVASRHPVWRSRALGAAVVASTLLQLAIPLWMPSPSIDVHAWNQTAVHALLHGVHPYTVQAPDVYGGRRDFGFTVAVYPYTPLTLLAFTPAVAALGDFRYTLACCLPITLWLTRAIASRLQTPAALSDAALLALLYHPGSFTMVWSGWTEPLLVVAAGAFVLCSLRAPQGFAQAVAFLCLPALKQYVVAPVGMFLTSRDGKPSVRVLSGALAVVLASAVPFVAWNWRATLTGIVFQMRAPAVPRPTAMSLVALAAASGLPYPPIWFSACVQVVVGALAWVRLRERGMGGLLLASALSLLATFLTGWQAFLNYYYFIGALLLFAAVALASTPQETPARAAVGTDTGAVSVVPLS